MTVVIDTNVFLAAAFWKGTARKCWAQCVANKISIAITDAIVAEYEQKAAVLAKRYPQIDPAPFLNWVTNECPRFAPAPLGKRRSRDATDDMFLSAALASGAKYLITRDADLLALEKPFGIVVLTDEQFLKLLKEL